MKRILSSLIIIALLASTAVGATQAFYHDEVVLGTNTFALGTVDLENAWTSGFPFSLNNLAPGQVSSTGVLGVGYGGSLTADLYFGVKADTGENLKDYLEYYIEEVTAGGTHIRNVFGWRDVSDAFTNWNLVADNVTKSQWKYYRLHVRVKDSADNGTQGMSATNYVIIYAVQDGGTAPGTAPWQYPTP